MSDTKALSGISVVDVCRGQSGSVCALLLGEAGASVTKIIEPGTSRALAFEVWDRDKQRVEVSLASSAGRQRVDELAAHADILLHDYPASEASALGLDEATLTARHPNLILGAVSAWPTSHPLSDRPTDGFLALAELGVLDEQLPIRRDGPVYVRFPLADWGGSYLLATGVLARLHAREATGKGGSVHTSLAQGAMGPMMMHWMRASKPTAALLDNVKKETPATLFECSDGKWLHVMSAVDSIAAMQEGLSKLGAAKVAELNAACAGTQYHFLPNFGANRAVFRTRPRQEWLDLFWANDIAVQPVVALGTFYDDEQSRVNGYVRAVKTASGQTWQPGAPFQIDMAADAGPVRPAPKNPRSPLEGLRVLDFGMFLAGPFAPMFLGDLGAEVIKVEPLRGDSMRPAEWVFTSCQRGKRGIALDLRSPDAKPILRRLVEWADVIHHNLRMPAAEKLGLGYEAVKAINPSIIYAHVSSYGPTGPRKDWPGFDQLFQAASGWEYEGAGEDNPPTWFRFGMVDHQCALASLVGVLAALHARDRTGRGALVRSSLLGAALLTTGETFRRADGTLSPYAKLDSQQTGVSPGRRLYRCADGWVAYAGEIAPLLRASATDGVTQLESKLSTMKVDDALALVDAHSMVRVRQNYGKQIFDDPAAIAAGLVASYPHPVLGRFEQLGAMWEFSELQLSLERAPPLLGQHTREVLENLGFDSSELSRLEQSKIILQAVGL